MRKSKSFVTFLVMSFFISLATNFSYGGQVNIAGSQSQTNDQMNYVNVDQEINALNYGTLGPYVRLNTTANVSSGSTSIPIPYNATLPANRWISITRTGSDIGGGSPCGTNWSNTYNAPAYNCNAPTISSASNVNPIGGTTSWDYYARVIDGVGGAGPCSSLSNVSNGPTYVSSQYPIKVTVSVASGSVPMYAVYRAAGGSGITQLVGVSAHQVLLDEGQVRQVQDGSTNGTTTFSTSSSSSFVQMDIGKTVIGPDIPSGTTISSIVDGNHVVLSQPATGTISGTYVVGATTDLNIPTTCDAASYNEDYMGQITSVGSGTLTVSPPTANPISLGAVIRTDDAPMLQTALNYVIKNASARSIGGTMFLKLPCQGSYCYYQMATGVVTGEKHPSNWGSLSIGGALQNQQAAGYDLIVGGTSDVSSQVTNVSLRDLVIFSSGITDATKLLASGLAFIGAQGFEADNLYIANFPNNGIVMDKPGTSGGFMTKIKFDKLKISNIGHHPILAGYGHVLDDLHLTEFFAQSGAQLTNAGTGGANYLGSVHIGAANVVLTLPEILGQSNMTNAYSSSNSNNGCYTAAIFIGNATGAAVVNPHIEGVGCGSGTRGLTLSNDVGTVVIGLQEQSPWGAEDTGIYITGASAFNSIISPVFVGGTHALTYGVDFNSKAGNVLILPTYQGTALVNFRRGVSNDCLLSVPGMADTSCSSSGFTSTGRIYCSTAASISGGGMLATGSNCFAGRITNVALSGNVLTPGFTCPNAVQVALTDNSTPGGARVIAQSTTTATFSATPLDTVDYIASCR